MNTPVYTNPEFDRYAAEYDAALAKGISVSGEDKTYFAEGRVAFLRHCLFRLGKKPQTLLDFGCGTGSATPYLLGLHGNAHVTGVDVSARSLEIARATHGSPQTEFFEFSEHAPENEMDLVFCNGVFHHIPLHQRATAVDYVFDALRPGGLFAWWENNPWNPGTRYVMSRIPFDRDAIPVPPTEACRLLKAGGFTIVRVDFLFVFPRFLRAFRWLEPHLSKLPVGAQYQVLCRKD